MNRRLRQWQRHIGRRRMADWLPSRNWRRENMTSQIWRLEEYSFLNLFHILQSRLENSEQRLKQLHEEYIRADNDRELLKDSLKRFRTVISRIYGRPTKVGDDEGGVEFRSIPLPSSTEFIVIDGGGIDPNRLDEMLNDLANRIENLQREKVKSKK